MLVFLLHLMPWERMRESAQPLILAALRIGCRKIGLQKVWAVMKRVFLALCCRKKAEEG